MVRIFLSVEIQKMSMNKGVFSRCPNTVKIPMRKLLSSSVEVRLLVSNAVSNLASEERASTLVFL